MDKPLDRGEESPGLLDRLGNMERRQFLTKAAAAGAVAWATPVILSRPAYAVEGGEGSPTCRPTISVDCTVVTCPTTGQRFPGIQITVGDCDCADPPQAPTVCARIDDLDPDLQAYANGTACNPTGATDVILPTNGTWACVDPSAPILIAPERDNPGVPPDDFPDNPAVVLDFRLGVWAGNCPPDLAYNCQTYDVHITIPAHPSPNQQLTIESCVFNPVPDTPDSDTLCTTGATSPCGAC